MSTPWSRAHARLLQQLPVRTHRRLEPQPGPSIIPEQYLNGRPVRIGRRTYPSITQAARAHQCSPRRIYDWIASGHAKQL